MNAGGILALPLQSHLIDPSAPVRVSGIRIKSLPSTVFASMPEAPLATVPVITPAALTVILANLVNAPSETPNVL